MSGNCYQRPVAVDLFAGAGGLSLGFEQAGFDIIAAVELDPIHAAIHKLNFPYTTVICCDVRNLSGDGIRNAAGLKRREIDAIIGGPPCQGFSLIGHRVIDDPRNALVFHFLRLVLELRPKSFVMENVPGMATGEHTQLLDELIQRFNESGYQVRLPYETLNAGNFGVPQDRRRLFLLGARSDCRLPEYPKPKTRLASKDYRNNGFNLFRDLPPCPTVGDAIGDLPNIEEDDSLLDSDEFYIELKDGSQYARMLRGEILDTSDYSYRRHWNSDIVTGCLRAEHTNLSRRRFSKTPPGTTEPVSRFYKPELDGICNTLRAGTASDRGAFSAPRPIHPTYARCISVREAARLHSYPDWFRFHRTIWHGFRQIGNSVPPLLARAVGSEIMRALDIRPRRPKACLVVGPATLASFDMRAAAEYFGVSPKVIAPRRRIAENGPGKDAGQHV